MDITLFIEHQCNLRCTYCYTGDKFRRPMSEDVLEKTVELSLIDNPSQVTLSFFGGEPMLRLPLLRTAVRLYRERYAKLGDRAPELRLLMNTNATRTDADEVAFLKDNHFVCNVSLDGPAHIHDAQRPDTGGAGTYEKVVAGLRRLEQAGLSYQLTSVVTPRSARHLGDVVRELFRHKAFRYTLAPDLSADWSDDALLDFRQGAVDAASAWSDSMRGGHSHKLEPLLTKLLSGVLGGIAAAARCNISLHEVTVSPLGNLYTCAQQVGEDRDPTYRIGNVETGIDGLAIARLRAMKSSASEVCGVCDLRHRCASDCGCKQLSASGVLGTIDGVLCETEEAWINAADYVCEELKGKQVVAFENFVDPRRWRLQRGAVLTPLRRKPSSVLTTS